MYGRPTRVLQFYQNIMMMMIVLAVFSGIDPTGRVQFGGRRWSTTAGPRCWLRRTAVSTESLPLGSGQLRAARGVAVSGDRVMDSPLSGTGRLAVGVEQSAARVAGVAG